MESPFDLECDGPCVVAEGEGGTVPCQLST
jgi:hypothetical protein